MIYRYHKYEFVELLKVDYPDLELITPITDWVYIYEFDRFLAWLFFMMAFWKDYDGKNYCVLFYVHTKLGPGFKEDIIIKHW